MRARIVSVIVVFTLLAGALITSPARAAAAQSTISVTNLDNSGAGSLRHAIGVALNGDTISFAVTGTIVLKSPLSISHSITISGPGPAKLTVSGNSLTRVFMINPGPTVTISGLTISGGYVTASSGGATGGGIMNYANLTLANVVVSSNKVYATGTNNTAYGGGIFNQGTMTIKNSTIDGNSALGVSTVENPSFGGGIVDMRTLTVIHSVISNNTSSYDAGGIEAYFGSTLTMTNSTMSGNVATYDAGGAIGVNSDACGGCSATLNLDHVSIDGNTAGIDGPGIWAQNSAIVTITNSSITNNKSTSTSYSNGGGLEIDDGTTATLTNVTISGNTLGANGQGGGILVGGDTGTTTLNLNNVTISNNSATTGGGIASTNGTVNFQNTLIANNTATTGPDCSTNTSLNSLDYNLIRATTGCTISGTTAHNITAANPRLGTLALNGSSTLSRALMTNSPAMDAANNASCPVTDQRGQARPQDGDGNGSATCDIGAFEDTPASPVSVTYRSVAADDGFVLESAQGSGLGGSLNASAGTFNVGDNGGNKQDRGILSFATDALPDDAVILHATLKLLQSSVTGNPSGLGSLVADIRSPFFGTGSALEAVDFQGAASALGVETFGAPSAGTYSAALNSSALHFINLTATTQFRLRFSTATDGDHAPDLLTIFSGDDSTAANRPRLIIQYYIP